MASLFSNISEKNKQRICHILEAATLTFPKNCQILSSVKHSIFIGYISSGSVQIRRLDSNGNLTVLEDLEEESIFDTSIYSLQKDEYEIITKEDTTLIAFEKDQMIQLDITHPFYYQFIQNFLQISMEKLSLQNEHIAILSQKSIRNKLLAYFKITSKKRGTKILYLDLSYSNLANYLAVDRCAMARELKSLEDEGFIKKEGKRISLLY